MGGLQWLNRGAWGPQSTAAPIPSFSSPAPGNKNDRCQAVHYSKWETEGQGWTRAHGTKKPHLPETGYDSTFYPEVLPRRHNNPC